MYKVELTEKEIREIGVNRHVKTVRKRLLMTFILGLFAVLVGAYYWDFIVGKVWMVSAGTAWVVFTLLQSRKAGRAGLKFLEDIKNGKDEA